MNFKRQLIKRLNLSNLLWSSLSTGLYCFNFHRIGKWEETNFDPCVFSCDVKNFEKYLIFLKENFRIISLDELTVIIAENKPITEKLALITFDDGYSDNYHLAFPLLKAFEIPATFFVTTSLINSTLIPWWDEIAWHVRQCSEKTIKLTPWKESVTIDTLPSKENIRSVLHQIKAYPSSIDSQLNELRALTHLAVPDKLKENMFMTWSQIKEMVQHNMTIGAHSHTHQILSCLPEEELNFELEESKRLIELNINKKVSCLSYPVGSAKTYNKTMYKAITSYGYQMAFTFRGVINGTPHKNNFELGRFAIDQPFNERVLKEMMLSAATI